MTPVSLTKKRCMRKQTLRPFFSFSFFYILIFMIGKNIGAAAATPAAPVPTPMQHRRAATMLGNKPPGII